MKPTQAEIGLKLPDSVKLTSRSRQAAEDRLNGKSHNHADRRETVRRGLANTIRHEITACLDEITRCAPAHVEGNLRAARVILKVTELVLSEKLVCDTELDRTGRQMGHPLTLADFANALDYTLTHHRAPAFFDGAQHDMDDVRAMFADVTRRLEQLASVAGIVADGSEVGR